MATTRFLAVQWHNFACHLAAAGGELPSRNALAQVIESLRGVLFPMRLGPADLRQESEDFYVGHTLDSVLHALLAQVQLELRYEARHLDSAKVLDLEERAVGINRCRCQA